jgi:hypothetical protein
MNDLNKYVSIYRQEADELLNDIDSDSALERKSIIGIVVNIKHSLNQNTLPYSSIIRKTITLTY